MEVQVLSKEEIRANAIAQLQRRKRIADRVILVSGASLTACSFAGAFVIAKASTTTKVTATGTGYVFTVVSAPFWMKAITFILWFALFAWLSYNIIKFGAELFTVKQISDYENIE